MIGVGLLSSEMERETLKNVGSKVIVSEAGLVCDFCMTSRRLPAPESMLLVTTTHETAIHRVLAGLAD